MAMLIGGPEEKYARLGLSYPEMMKAVEAEERLQGLLASLDTGPETSIHRHVQKISEGLDSLAASFTSGRTVASGTSPVGRLSEMDSILTRAMALLDTPERQTQGVTAFIYADTSKAFAAVSASLLDLERKLEALAKVNGSGGGVKDPARAEEAVYEFRSTTLASAANHFVNRCREAGIPEHGLGEYETSRAASAGARLAPGVEKDLERVLDLQAAWRRVSQAI